MRYRYKALSADGALLQGELEAGSRELAIRTLQEAGHLPVQAEPSTPGLSSLRRTRHREVAVLTRELTVMLRAGLPLDRCLQLLQQLAEHPAGRRLAQQLHEQVQAGNPFSAALAAQPKVFDRLYISLVRAGEASGDMAGVLERLAGYLERALKTRNLVISALIYPAILLLITLASLLLLLGVVIPRFEILFAGAGSALPLLTELVFGAAAWVRSYWLVALLLGAGGYGTARLLLRKPARRLQWHQLLLALPGLGTLLQRLEVARMARTLGTLLANDVPILQAVDIARETLRNAALAAQLEQASATLRRGGRLADALEQGHRFPALAIQLLRVGEETGEVETMLLHVADVYDEQSTVTLQRLLALLGPVLILLLGGLIAVVVLSTLLAILSLNELVL